MKISIAIPTYNSSRYLSDNLGNLINVNSISEIVVRDDKSSSDEEKKIQEIIKNFQKKIDCEIKFFSNDKGILAIMYHRFNENKYPSTNIRMEIFKKHMEIITKKKI